jgi:hypothetical protein
MSLQMHDIRLVKAEIEARYHHRHARHERRDSSLEVIRRTHGRDAWQETHPGRTR